MHPLCCLHCVSSKLPAQSLDACTCFRHLVAFLVISTCATARKERKVASEAFTWYKAKPSVVVVISYVLASLQFPTRRGIPRLVVRESWAENLVLLSTKIDGKMGGGGSRRA